MSSQAAENQIVLVNNTQYTISARITNDNDDTGNTGFFDIEPGSTETWKRTHWQVAFVLRNSTRPSDNRAETLVVKPTGVYNLNDN